MRQKIISFLLIFVMLFMMACNPDKGKYTVTFNTGEGASTIASITNVERGSKIEEPEDPVKTGYKFNGWYKEVLCINVWDFSSDTVNSNITLYAAWDNVAQYEVSFETDGADIIASVNVNEGAKISKPADPQKQGYVFSGWYNENVLETVWDFDSDMVYKNLTLYAKWTAEGEAEQFALKFNSNGGTIVSLQRIAQGEKSVKPINPTKSGFVFDGWFLDNETFSNAWNFDINTVTKDTVLYAKWNQAQSYLIEFESNDGSAVDSQLIEQGRKVLKPKTPMRDGYRLDGWYLDNDTFKIQWNFNTDTVDKASTLYAKWLPIGGTAIKTPEQFNQIALTEGGRYYLATELDFSNHTWTPVSSNNASFNGIIDGNGMTISNLTINLEGSSVFGAIFNKFSGSIKNLSLKNINITSTIQRAAVLVGESSGSIEFENISISDSTVIGNKNEGVGGLIGTIKHQATANNISIKNTTIFNNAQSAGGLCGRLEGRLEAQDIDLDISVEGQRPGAIAGEIKSASTLSVERAVIRAEVIGTSTASSNRAGGMVGNIDKSMCWATDVFIDLKISGGNTSGHIAGSGQVMADNVYARLRAGSSLKGGGVNAENVITESSLSEEWWQDNISSIAGYWYYNEGFMSLNMQGSEAVIYDVYFIFGHGEADINIGVVAGRKTSPPVEIPNIHGYRFTGWFRDNTYNEEFDFSTPINGLTEIYAGWQAIRIYNVKVEILDVQTSYLINEGDNISQILIDPYREGYVFEHWMFNGQQYDPLTPINGNIIISAKFKNAQKYTVTLEPMQGILPQGQTQFEFYENQAVSLPVPVSDSTDLSFKGWFENDSFTIRFNKTYLTSDITLYARYSGIIDPAAYNLGGFAQGAVSIPDLKEGDAGYYVANNEKEFLQAIAMENSAVPTYAARVIEIRADLNLGYKEVQQKYPQYAGTFKNFESHNIPSLHPVLIETGISKITIQNRDGNTAKYSQGLMIYSKTGHTIKHATFSIKRSSNIIVRNLKFDELWEWDETVEYDSKDWDYFTIEAVNGIWFDHVELGKAYDGLIDFKYGEPPVQNATFSYLKMEFKNDPFVRIQIEDLYSSGKSSLINGMKNAGMTIDKITELVSFQKKGFLMGGSEFKPNRITLTIMNSYVVNLQDRFPRLRGDKDGLGGDVHLFNNYYDADDVAEFKKKAVSNWGGVLNKNAKYGKMLTNQAIVTTEDGSIGVENSVFKGVTQVIKSNQTKPGTLQYTGKYYVKNCMFLLGGSEFDGFIGSSHDEQGKFIGAENTPFYPANISTDPVLDFSWNAFDDIPYSYDGLLIDVTQLQNFLIDIGCGIGIEGINFMKVNQV